MTSYHYLGLIFACAAGICLLASVLCLVILKTSERRPLYLRRLPRKRHPEEFLKAVENAYEVSGDIRGMLLLLQEKWKKGVPAKRVPAALDYLENSRYKDFETTLRYLSDQTDTCETVLNGILEKEIRKRTALTEKRSCRNPA